jgi:hypothetical protein
MCVVCLAAHVLEAPQQRRGVEWQQARGVQPRKPRP